MTPFLIFVAIVAVVSMIAIYTRKADIRSALERNEARREWGVINDLAMADRPDPNPPIFSNCITGISDERLDPFRPIKFIPMGTSHNFLEGMCDGREVKVFDHRQVVSNGKSSYVVEHSIVAVKLRAGVPKFELRPHKFWDHVAALFGYRDFVIHSPEFDKRFHISYGDDDYLLGLLDYAVQDRLLAHRNDSWHCINGYLVLVGLGYRSDFDLDRMLSDALWFADQVDR